MTDLEGRDSLEHAMECYTVHAVAACILFALEEPSVQLQQPVLEGVFMAIRAWYYSPFTLELPLPSSLHW